MLPIYMEKLTKVELEFRAEQLLELQQECMICPRQCLAKREISEVKTPR
jgi:hypothetical protein